MLDPAWVEAHHTEFDVYHLHFGFDAQSPDELRALIRALRRHGKPLVQTVHDLRNPHHLDPGPHDAALDVLIPAADRLITLTRGAADEIERRWSRTARVLPHPHVVEEPELSMPRPPHDGFVVGVHAKSIRPNMRPLSVIHALAEIIEQLPDASLRVDIHTETGNPDAYAYAPHTLEALRSLADDGLIDLRIHDYFDDTQLWDYLRSLDLSVLPYAFGTHSGWLEACYDLGTAVAAPDCGYYAQQRPCFSYHMEDDGPDADTLRSAVLRARHENPAPRARPEARAAEREQIAAAHRALYEEVLR
ncbi:glycosyltransferase family 1 protein [Streptomyces sp. NPDC051098]|uniref:glycosyltransferase family 1 protein n=1 Tax=Streptomyces sp. NPDC051098 TaxID=3155411 RepID=UPI0034247D3A